MSRVLGLLLVGVLAIGSTGCVGPMGGCCGSGSGLCGSDLGGCSVGGCDTACSGGSCGGGSCDSCTGCGELYVDPWVNHPADCVDPCDACGNYNGQSCGSCRPMFAGFKSLWGYRCGCDPGPVATTDRCFAPSCDGCDSGCDSCMMEPACGCEGACDCGISIGPGCGCEESCSCGVEPGCGFEPACGCESGGCSCGGGVAMSQDVSLNHGEYVVDSYAPSGDDVASQPYKPHRTRKIFTPRSASTRGFLNEHRR